MGTTAKEFNVTVVRITEKDGFHRKETVQRIKDMIREKPGTSIHGSLPCTPWTSWQNINVAKNGPAYAKKLLEQRDFSLSMLHDFIEISDLAVSLGGEVSFEWPNNASAWINPGLVAFIHRHDLFSVRVDGCAVGKTDSNGHPQLKPWRFLTSSERVAISLGKLRCTHDKDFQHAVISGVETKATASYTAKLCRTYLSAQYGYNKRVPAMPLIAVQPDEVHRQHETDIPNFGASPMMTPTGFTFDLEEVLDDENIRAIATHYRETMESRIQTGGLIPSIEELSDTLKCYQVVTKLLKRSEWGDSSYEAIRAEASGLLKSGTWLEDTVMEKDDLIGKAKKSGEKVHLGDLLTLCNIKYAELAKEFQKSKGRICFRGDSVKDENGAAAVFQEMSSSPTAIQTANANIAYGCIPGHSSSTADAIRAYVQSLLKSKHKTWVRIPYELWPTHWRGKYRAPMCLLVKALYGHPESGGHWENHLTEAIKHCGGVPVENHNSSFWFETRKLLLTVYVDDLLLSGPTDNHNQLRDDLRFGKHPIACDDPEPLSRFLGRNHDDY